MRFDPAKLRAARGDRPLEDVAKAAGTSRFTVARWESGRGEPSATQLHLVATFLGRSLRFFYSATRAA